jgi:hypothetical protein
MKLAKQKTNTNTGVKIYSANDMRLKRYQYLNDQIKELTKELSQIKEEIKHQGSFNTLHFICLVETTTEIRAPNKEELLKIYGTSVTKYFKEGTRTTIKIQEKGGG